MPRRFHFSLRALLHLYAISLLIGGLLVAGTAFGTAIEATTASALAERVSTTKDRHEVFLRAYQYLETQSRRKRVIFTVLGLAVAAAFVPLFLAEKPSP